MDRSSRRHRPPARCAALFLLLAVAPAAAQQGDVLPEVRIDFPELTSNTASVPMPPTMTFGYTGDDPDSDGGLSAGGHVRFLFRRALLPDGSGYISTRYELEQHLDELVSFADSAWSLWYPYASDPAERRITFPDQPARDGEGRLIHYLFAVQVIDASGAVSLERRYGREVVTVYVSGSLSPKLHVVELDLGQQVFVGANGIALHDVASGQELDFQWLGLAAHYGCEIASYRYGWDLADPEDPYDPGWAVSPGLSPGHMRTGGTAFSAGIHTLTVECRDTLDQTTRAQVVLSVVPVPDPALRRPLLLVDDVPDRDSLAWPSADGLTPYDNDVYRDAFWEGVLAGPGGVAGFDPQYDVIDTETEAATYRDLVGYRDVIWTTRYSAASFVQSSFQPERYALGPYNWLATYQEHAGSLLLAGERALNGFIETGPNDDWMLPWIFASEETFLEVGGDYYRVGFGSLDLPDGTDLALGPWRYPARRLGLGSLDHVRPFYPLYGLTGAGSVGNDARSSNCGGLKAVTLEADFALQHGAWGAFPDTIFTDPQIDWRDDDPLYRDQLQTFIWGSDEIYDGDLWERPPAWDSADCGGELCVEPMFRSYSRFDWVDDLHLAAGDPGWPAPHYEEEDLPAVCGQHLLDPATGRSRTSGQIVGFVSHRTEPAQPYIAAPVVWGFDPHRFDHDGMTAALRWLLASHFGLGLKDGGGG